MSLDCRHAVTRRSMVPKTCIFIGFLKLFKLWRRGWDSNPRYGFPYARFRGEYFQPLSHLSADGEARLADESATRQRRCWRWLLYKIKRAKRPKNSAARSEKLLQKRGTL